MNETEEDRELARKIEQANRIAARINDPSTYERLKAWAEELRQKLLKRLETRRSKQEITARARELWDQNGRPINRDLEFWLQAEAEIRERELREVYHSDASS